MLLMDLYIAHHSESGHHWGGGHPFRVTNYDRVMPLFAAWLVHSVDYMKASLSGREPVNRVAEPGPDLLEIDVFEVTKSVEAKNRFHANRLETAGPTFTNFVKLFSPLWNATLESLGTERVTKASAFANGRYHVIALPDVTSSLCSPALLSQTTRVRLSPRRPSTKCLAIRVLR
jgi:hypothetical protein